MYKVDLENLSPFPSSPFVHVTFQEDTVAERNQEDAKTLMEIVLSNCKDNHDHPDVPMHFNPMMYIDEKKIADNNCFVLLSSYLYQYAHYKLPPSSQEKLIDCLNLIALCREGKERVYNFIFNQMNLEPETGWTSALREFFNLCNEKVVDTGQGNFPNSIEFGITLFRRYGYALDNEDHTTRYIILARYLIRSELFPFEGFAYYSSIETNDLWADRATALYKKYAPEDMTHSATISRLVDLAALLPKDLSQEPWGVAGERLKAMVLQGMFDPHSKRSLVNFFWKMMDSHIEDWHTLLINP